MSLHFGFVMYYDYLCLWCFLPQSSFRQLYLEMQSLATCDFDIQFQHKLFFLTTFFLSSTTDFYLNSSQSIRQCSSEHNRHFILALFTPWLSLAELSFGGKWWSVVLKSFLWKTLIECLLISLYLPSVIPFLKNLLSQYAIISASGLNKTLVFFSSHFSKPIKFKVPCVKSISRLSFSCLKK